jgi:putative ABC transport system substrate-binding protein
VAWRFREHAVNNKIVVCLLATLALAAIPSVQAQPRKPYRIGVIHEGGSYLAAVEGLKDGLKELGLQPGKDVLLEIRDLHGNRRAAGDGARSLEQGKVELLYTLSTSVTLAAKAATKDVPIVFAIGSDAAADGLVTSLARPGGRLTGVQRLSSDFTPKRLEILKEINPKLHRVATFYDPDNSVAVQAAKLAQEAARQLKVEIEERSVRSVEELRQAVGKLDPKRVDAFFYINDAMVTSESKLIIDAANVKKLATMFSDPESVTQGALVAYGVNRYDEGKLSAKYVQRVLTGTNPRDMPVESFSRYELGINLQTARKLGITIPQAVLFRAEKVVE